MSREILDQLILISSANICGRAGTAPYLALRLFRGKNGGAEQGRIALIVQGGGRIIVRRKRLQALYSNVLQRAGRAGTLGGVGRLLRKMRKTLLRKQKFLCVASQSHLLLALIRRRC